ncbi:MAG: hypothetical protein JRM78_00090 [Nitrososphaerota archaeon]|nr:hypothetical protein [Nitrososphaerota archaeon]
MTDDPEAQPFERANNRVPSGRAQCSNQAEFEFLNYLRSTRFYILLAIIATIGIANMAVVYVYRPPHFFLHRCRSIQHRGEAK